MVLKLGAEAEMQPNHSPVTPGAKSEFYPGVHLLRATAAVFVLVQHSLAYASTTVGVDYKTIIKLDFGLIGVVAFFCISGFVIGTIRTMPTGDFILRRILRIYPAFWAAYLLSALIVVPLPTNFKLKTFLLLPTNQMPILYVPMWTLIFEMFFYAVTAAVFSMRLKDNTLTALGVCWIIVISMFEPYLTETYYAAPGWLICISQLNIFFVLGLLCSINIERLQRLPTIAFLIIGLAVLTLQKYVPVFPSATHCLLFGIFICSLIMAATSIERIWRPLSILGDASYGLFLLHWSVLVFLTGQLKPLALSVTTLAIVYFLVAGAAGVAFGIAEHRFYNLTKRIRLRAPIH